MLKFLSTLERRDQPAWLYSATSPSLTQVGWIAILLGNRAMGTTPQAHYPSHGKARKFLEFDFYGSAVLDDLPRKRSIDLALKRGQFLDGHGLEVHSNCSVAWLLLRA